MSSGKWTVLGQLKKDLKSFYSKKSYRIFKKSIQLFIMRLYHIFFYTQLASFFVPQKDFY